jgi:hypothetical protein
MTFRITLELPGIETREEAREYERQIGTLSRIAIGELMKDPADETIRASMERASKVLLGMRIAEETDSLGLPDDLDPRVRQIVEIAEQRAEGDAEAACSILGAAYLSRVYLAGKANGWPVRQILEAADAALENLIEPLIEVL